MLDQCRMAEQFKQVVASKKKEEVKEEEVPLKNKHA